MKTQLQITVESIDPALPHSVTVDTIPDEATDPADRPHLVELDREARFGVFGTLIASVWIDENRNFAKFPEACELRIDDERRQMITRIRFESTEDIMMLADALHSISERRPLRSECGCW